MAAPHQKFRLTLSTFALTMFWLGLAIGVSFLATPAKFLAPSLLLPVALDVGRYTFSVLNKLEWLLAAALLLLVMVRKRTWLSVVTGFGVLFLVLAETAWLLPLLDRRVGLIIAGQQPPTSNLHFFYIAVEVVKLGALGLVATDMALYLRRTLRNSYYLEAA